MVAKVKNRARPPQARRRGYTRISSKNQVTLPAEVLAATGLKSGDLLKVVNDGGDVRLIREDDPLVAYGGMFTGAYGPNYLEELRKEWD